MTKEKAKEWLYEIVKYPTEDTIIELVSELEEQNTNLQEMLKVERSVTCKEKYLKRVSELEDKLANADYQLEGRDIEISELKAQLKITSLKIINCIKNHLCKQDEDYDKPIISPKFLSDTLDQMAIDGFEGDKRK